MRTGDRIRADVPARRIEVLVSDDELARRRTEGQPQPQQHARGYGAIFAKHITQADQGCDFDILETRPGTETPEPDIY